MRDEVHRGIAEMLERLRGQSFLWKRYRQWSDDWDHDHCAACFAKFSETIEGDDVLREGYAVTADYSHGADYEWVCAPCFTEFRADLGWTEVPAATVQ